MGWGGGGEVGGWGCRESIPKSEFGKTQAVHTEGKEGENWLTNYSLKI